MNPQKMISLALLFIGALTVAMGLIMEIGEFGAGLAYAHSSVVGELEGIALIGVGLLLAINGVKKFKHPDSDKERNDHEVGEDATIKSSQMSAASAAGYIFFKIYSLAKMLFLLFFILQSDILSLTLTHFGVPSRFIVTQILGIIGIAVLNISIIVLAKGGYKLSVLTVWTALEIPFLFMLKPNENYLIESVILIILFDVVSLAFFFGRSLVNKIKELATNK
ncbi:MAG: hypothetical protein WC246_01420 [Candidatus Paceibacterota bacterium]|jgi:hypothetical protein